MLQLLVLLFCSWLLIWFFEKKNLTVLGLIPSKEKQIYCIILFLVSAILSSSAFILRMIFIHEEYVISDSFTFRSFGIETWNQFRSVLTEELLCRAALLYLVIKKFGQKQGIIFSSVLFTIFHWLNVGVWGSLNQLILISIFTFAMGLLLAYSYARTFSILFPLAIHFGWNLVQNYFFPDTTSGHHMFILAAPTPEVTISYFAFFTMLLFPKFSVLLLNYAIVSRIKQVETP